MPNLIYILLRRLRWPLVTLVSVYAILVLGFVLIPGVDDQGRPWRMDFFHAFYFVSFMGSTIGFGEIPYPFNGMQRMWTLVGIYASVITWLYGIGALLAMVQDPAFRRLMTDHRFQKKVRGIHEPFYIICGFGDTGKLLATALAEEAIRCVVIDNRQERIDDLIISDLPLLVPGICDDATRADVLKKTGIEFPSCRGVMAITDSDEANLSVALACHLIRPELTVIARAENRDAAANINSFGVNVVINPFQTFADRLALAMHSPGMFVLFEWMTGVPHETLREPVFPPRGEWILCGYGRFGHAVYDQLISEGIHSTIVEATPKAVGAPKDAIEGTGTEADTLIQAGVRNAVGIVAGTDNDANNLSIILTAREINPNLFTVARQNRRQNDELFHKANVDLLMQRGSVIAHKIYALIRTPLIERFLRRAQQHDNDWANSLVSRISGVVSDEVPHVWQLRIDSAHTPAYAAKIGHQPITLRDMRRDPRNRDAFLDWIPLFLKRGFDEVLLPPMDAEIRYGDELLLCGRLEARRQMEWTAGNEDVLAYVLTGEEHPSSLLGRWLTRKREDEAGLSG